MLAILGYIYMAYVNVELQPNSRSCTIKHIWVSHQILHITKLTKIITKLITIILKVSNYTNYKRKNNYKSNNNCNYKCFANNKDLWSI